MVISITPLEPLDPYIAAEDASFNTSKEATSFISRFPKKSLSTGKPSTTIKGAELPFKEPTPLTLIVGADPASPSVAAILTPAIWPTRASSTLATAIWSKSSFTTLATAPVI